MATKTVEQVLIEQDRNMVLLGSAIEALFLAHPNKSELARIFKERSDTNFAALSKKTDLEKRAFVNICNRRDVLIDGIKEKTAGG